MIHIGNDEFLYSCNSKFMFIDIIIAGAVVTLDLQILLAAVSKFKKKCIRKTEKTILICAK